MIQVKRIYNVDRTTCDNCDNFPRIMWFITTDKNAVEGSDYGLSVCGVCVKSLGMNIRRAILNPPVAEGEMPKERAIG